MAKYPDLNQGQIEAIGNKLGGVTGIMQFLAGDLVVVAKNAANKLLEFVESVTMPSVKKFVADDRFKDGVDVEGVTIYTGGDFKKAFGGRVEENVAGCDIRVHNLTRASRDLGIR